MAVRVLVASVIALLVVSCAPPGPDPAKLAAASAARYEMQKQQRLKDEQERQARAVAAREQVRVASQAAVAREEALRARLSQAATAYGTCVKSKVSQWATATNEPAETVARAAVGACAAIGAELGFDLLARIEPKVLDFSIAQAVGLRAQAALPPANALGPKDEGTVTAKPASAPID